MISILSFNDTCSSASSSYSLQERFTQLLSLLKVPVSVLISTNWSLFLINTMRRGLHKCNCIPNIKSYSFRAAYSKYNLQHFPFGQFQSAVRAHGLWVIRSEESWYLWGWDFQAACRAHYVFTERLEERQVTKRKLSLHMALTLSTVNQLRVISGSLCTQPLHYSCLR